MQIRDEAELAQLLREAAQAHHAYEQNLGRPDEGWPEWYARHIAERVAGRESGGGERQRS